MKRGFSKTKSKSYQAWNAMVQRCTNPNCYGYKFYGGAGISMHPKWASFEKFLKDVGEKPDGAYALARINKKKGYVPGNVQWKCNDKFMECWGRQATTTEWARIAGLSRSTLESRLRMNKPFEEALNDPASVYTIRCWGSINGVAMDGKTGRMFEDLPSAAMAWLGLQAKSKEKGIKCFLEVVRRKASDSEWIVLASWGEKS